MMIAKFKLSESFAALGLPVTAFLQSAHWAMADQLIETTIDTAPATIDSNFAVRFLFINGSVPPRAAD